MTNKTISITCASDDYVALRAFGNALEEMALANGAESRKTVGELNFKVNVDTTEATAAIEMLNTKESVEQRLTNATNLLMEAAPAMLQDGKFDGVEVSGPRKSDQFSVDRWVEMVHPDHNTTLMARSEAEIQQRIGEGLSVAESEPTDNTQLLSSTVTLDKDGLPWDARIHAASKALNVDGTWRVRRKPKDMEDDAWAQEIESVRADLKQLMAIESGATHELKDVKLAGEPIPVDGGFSQGYTATVEPLPELADVLNIAAEFGTGIANAALTGDHLVPPPVTIEPPVTPPTVETMTFPKLMTFLTERHGKITLVQVNELVAKHGLTNIQQFAQRPDLIGAFVADVKTLLGE